MEGSPVSLELIMDRYLSCVLLMYFLARYMVLELGISSRKVESLYVLKIGLEDTSRMGVYWLDFLSVNESGVSKIEEEGVVGAV